MIQAPIDGVSGVCVQVQDCEPGIALVEVDIPNPTKKGAKPQSHSLHPEGPNTKP